jgi:1-pyrroline-5-carboxylate dehydrogenase
LVKELKISSPLEFDTFTSAVIDEKAYDRINSYIEYGRNSSNLKLLIGSPSSKSQGYYVKPTIFQTSDPHDRIMHEEIFGPVLSVYVYKDNKYDQVLDLVDKTTPYALTGSIFCQDEKILKQTMLRLRQSQGNLYLNDKSTGAVVNQQPFGGSRLSGTNDKPGGPYNCLKWSNPLTVKQYNLPISSYKHTSML